MYYVHISIWIKSVVIMILKILLFKYSFNFDIVNPVSIMSSTNNTYFPRNALNLLPVIVMSPVLSVPSYDY